METAIFAVLMSVYKNDKPSYLKEAVMSILSQSFRDYKYFISIDGPIGYELRKVLESISDSRIEIIESKDNKGLATILNGLLDKCRKEGYEFIARMDADDISVLDRFEKQIAYLQAHPNVDMVGGAINEIDENGNNRGKIIHYPCAPDNCRKFFAKRNPVAHPTVMFRRSFFEKVGWKYPTDFVRNEDTRLWHEGYKHGCVIANLPDVLLNFRITDNMFKHRRNGHEFAKSQLKLRKLIAKDLGYGIKAYIYAYAMYLLMICPSWVLKFAYKMLR